MKKVLIAAPISTLFRNTLLEKGYELIEFNSMENGMIYEGIVGIVTSNKLTLNAITLQLFGDLKWIARLGSGMEIIDTVYCDQNNIHYYSSPQGIANSVAEHMIGMLLSLLHHIPRSYSQIQSGQWVREENRGIELENQVVGVIGYGHTGKAMIEKLQVFTKHILVYDKFKSGYEKNGFKEVELDELQAFCDIITFHVPLNEDTRGYYNDQFLEKMQKNHIVLNASRGEVAHTSTILKGLQSGKIIGACLDVLEEEKKIQEVLKQDENTVQELLKHRVLITPHIAGYSFNAIEKMSQELLDQLTPIL